MINLGTDFDNHVLELAGLDPSTVDMDTVQIPFLNPGGQTTVRATVMVNVPTDQLTVLIKAATEQ